MYVCDVEYLVQKYQMKAYKAQVFKILQFFSHTMAATCHGCLITVS